MIKLKFQEQIFWVKVRFSWFLRYNVLIMKIERNKPPSFYKNAYQAIGVTKFLSQLKKLCSDRKVHANVQKSPLSAFIISFQLENILSLQIICPREP